MKNRAGILSSVFKIFLDKKKVDPVCGESSRINDEASSVATCRVSRRHARD